MKRGLFGGMLIVLLAAMPAFAQVADPGSLNLGAPVGFDAGASVYDTGLGSGAAIVEQGGAGERWWVAAEYLLWRITPDPIPALASTGTRGSLGEFGNPNTGFLVGGEKEDEIGRRIRYGWRVTFGCMLDSEGTTSVEATGFLFGRKSNDILVGPDINPVVARPFTNVNTGAETSELVNYPGFDTGNVSVSTPSFFWGAELNLARELCRGWCYKDFHVTLLGGFRHLDLDEKILIREVKEIANPVVLPPGFDPTFVQFAGSTFVIRDQFRTHNLFYAPQAGLDLTYAINQWAFALRGKVALGATEEVIAIGGSQTLSRPDGTTTVYPAGVLAVASNSGRFERWRFAAAEELDINVGYRVCGCLDLFAGFTLLNWSKVMRPGDQVDLNVDILQIPNFPQTGPATNQVRPYVPFKEAELWAVGVNFGTEFHW